mmetsp:Transcript_34221/g.80622  ORF Transcript_34221/g.80622 Transcript_34221/m.80622 type:complete len:99 (-) Transcript_34221:860-1156(-)
MLQVPFAELSKSMKHFRVSSFPSLCLGDYVVLCDRSFDAHRIVRTCTACCVGGLISIQRRRFKKVVEAKITPYVGHEAHDKGEDKQTRVEVAVANAAK